MYFSCVLRWAVITAGGGHVTPGWCPRCELLTPCVTFGDNELKWFLFGQTMELVDHACQESWHLTTWESWYNWKKYLVYSLPFRCRLKVTDVEDARRRRTQSICTTLSCGPLGTTDHQIAKRGTCANELAARAGHRGLPLEFVLQ